MHSVHLVQRQRLVHKGQMSSANVNLAAGCQAFYQSDTAVIALRLAKDSNSEPLENGRGHWGHVLPPIGGKEKE